MVLIYVLKRSKLIRKLPVNQPLFAFSRTVSSIGAGRLHQRQQFVDRLLRDLPYAIGVFHSGDVDAFHHRSDLIAKIGEKSQRIALLVGYASNQARDQDLASDHASV